MKTLICQNPGNLILTETEIPMVQEGYALLKIKKIGICGTDLHAFEGTQPFFSYPRILGHELAAEIVEVDPATGFSIEEAVTISPYFYCGSCIACRNGKENCCTNIKVCGVHIDGGMREYLTVPTYSLIHGQGLGFEDLALIEPLAIGAHGVRRAHVGNNEFVLVIGAGPIGLGTVEMARIAGGQVIALDINDNRLQFCKKEKLGVQHVVNGLNEDVVERLKEITKGDMPTVVIDCTGNKRAIQNGFQYMAHGGRYVLIGLQREDIVFNHPEFHKRESTLMSSRNANAVDFKNVIDAMLSGKINPSNYITHRIAFEDLPAIFSTLILPETGVIKAMVSIN